MVGEQLVSVVLMASFVENHHTAHTHKCSAVTQANATARLHSGDLCLIVFLLLLGLNPSGAPNHERRLSLLCEIADVDAPALPPDDTSAFALAAAAALAGKRASLLVAGDDEDKAPGPNLEGVSFLF